MSSLGSHEGQGKDLQTSSQWKLMDCRGRPGKKYYWNSVTGKSVWQEEKDQAIMEPAVKKKMKEKSSIEDRNAQHRKNAAKDDAVESSVEKSSFTKPTSGTGDERARVKLRAKRKCRMASSNSQESPSNSQSPCKPITTRAQKKTQKSQTRTVTASTSAESDIIVSLIEPSGISPAVKKKRKHSHLSELENNVVISYATPAKQTTKASSSNSLSSSSSTLDNSKGSNTPLSKQNSRKKKSRRRSHKKKDGSSKPNSQPTAKQNIQAQSSLDTNKHSPECIVIEDSISIPENASTPANPDYHHPNSAVINPPNASSTPSVFTLESNKTQPVLGALAEYLPSPITNSVQTPQRRFNPFNLNSDETAYSSCFPAISFHTPVASPADQTVVAAQGRHGETPTGYVSSLSTSHRLDQTVVPCGSGTQHLPQRAGQVSSWASTSRTPPDYSVIVLSDSSLQEDDSIIVLDDTSHTLRQNNGQVSIVEILDSSGDEEVMEVDDDEAMQSLIEVREQANNMDSQPIGDLTSTILRTSLARVNETVLEQPPDLPVISNLVLVLDTNVLIHSIWFVRDLLHSSIPGRGPVFVVLPWAVMQELDVLKMSRNSVNLGQQKLAYSCISAVRLINDQLLKKNPFLVGQTPQEANEKADIPIESNDDRILQCCLHWLKKKQE